MRNRRIGRKILSLLPERDRFSQAPPRQFSFGLKQNITGPQIGTLQSMFYLKRLKLVCAKNFFERRGGGRGGRGRRRLPLFAEGEGGKDQSQPDQEEIFYRFHGC